MQQLPHEVEHEVATEPGEHNGAQEQEPETAQLDDVDHLILLSVIKTM